MSDHDKTIQAQLAELDELIAWFDQPDFDLDQAMAKFSEGMKLAQAVKTKLATLENKIVTLRQRFDAPES